MTQQSFNRIALCCIILLHFFVSCNRKTSPNEKADTTTLSDSSVKTAPSGDTASIGNQPTNQDKLKKKPCNSEIPKAFSVVSATSQRWSGGVKGSGSGINYRITIIAYYPSTELVIDKLWIDTTFHEVQVKKNKFPDATAFNKNDTLIILASDYFKSPDKPNFSEDKKETQDSEKPNIKPPYKYSGSALIGFKLNKNRKYIEVKEILKLNSLYYP